MAGSAHPPVGMGGGRQRGIAREAPPAPSATARVGQLDGGGRDNFGHDAPRGSRRGVGPLSGDNRFGRPAQTGRPYQGGTLILPGQRREIAPRPRQPSRSGGLREWKGPGAVEHLGSRPLQPVLRSISAAGRGPVRTRARSPRSATRRAGPGSRPSPPARARRCTGPSARPRSPPGPAAAAPPPWPRAA
jgi:hypothetical protein